MPLRNPQIRSPGSAQGRKRPARALGADVLRTAIYQQVKSLHSGSVRPKGAIAPGEAPRNSDGSIPPAKQLLPENSQGLTSKRSREFNKATQVNQDRRRSVDRTGCHRFSMDVCYYCCAKGIEDE